MKNLSSFFMLFFLASLLTAQPAIEWQKAFGGSKDDTQYDIQNTSDGGTIMAGMTYSNDGDATLNHGEQDFWVVKLNVAGDIEWQKSLGGSSYDGAHSIQQTSDGGYIIAGYTYSNDGDVSGYHGKADCWVVKITHEGEIQWQKAFGGTGSDSAISAIQTIDGGYIVAASTESNDGDVSGNPGTDDIWVIKLSNAGDIQWQKLLGGSAADFATSIQQTNDGGYIVAGHTCSNDGDVTGFHGVADVWIVKLNDVGDIQWQKAFGGIGKSSSYSALQTNDGGYIVAASTEANDGDVSGNNGISDGWIIKLSDLGNLEWQKTIGGSLYDIVSSIRQTHDGGYIVAASSLSTDGDVTGNHGATDFWVVKLGDSGVIQWQKCIGGANPEASLNIQQTSDYGYIVIGQIGSPDWDISGYHGKIECGVVKLAPESVDVLTQPVSQLKYLEISPNPTSSHIFLNISPEVSRLSVIISNLMGQKLIQQTIETADFLDVSALPNGLYVMVASSASGEIYTNKLTISK